MDHFAALRSTIKFSNVGFIRTPPQLIIAFEVARNGLPIITGTWPRGFTAGAISRTMKSTEKMNSPTLISTSAISLSGTFTDLSASWRVTFVGFNSTKLLVDRVMKQVYTGP